jgi:DNA processing protein
LNEIEALAALSCTPYIGPIKIRLLIQRFGSAVAAYHADPLEIAELPGFSPKVMTHWKASDAWERELSLAARFKVSLISYKNPEYPKSLLNLTDYPVLLYVLGKLEPSDQQGFAVIGSREASPYGLKMAAQFARDLADQGHTVVSGLARGIDTAAHYGALERGRTIAVIGSGLANIYPPENNGLARKIVENGALISEFAMTTPPDRQNFPQRNRIVSGMSQGTILIEAPEKSGAMLTAELALSQGKRVFALPGQGGNLTLIKKKEATLVESAQDVLREYEELFSAPHSKASLKSGC